MTLNVDFDTFCLVFDEGNAVNTDDGLQIRQHECPSDS